MKKKISIAVTLLLFLTGCLSQKDTPVETPINVPALQTSAVNTVLAIVNQTATANAPTNTPQPTATLIPTPTLFGGGSGSLIFSYYRSGFGELFPELRGELNVFTSNADGSNLVPITNGLNGYNTIQSISPDGSKILVTSFRYDPATNTGRTTRTWDLFLCSLADPNWEPLKLASGSSWSFENIAEWVDNNTIVYAGLGAQGLSVYTINSDGSNVKNILKNNQGVTPVKVFLGADYIYWGSQSKNSLFLDFWKSSMDGSEQEPVTVNGLQIKSFFFSISPDKTKVVWDDERRSVHFAELSAMDQSKFVTYTSFSGAYFMWYPDSTKFLVITSDSFSLTEYEIVTLAPNIIEVPSITSFNTLYEQPKISRKKTYTLSPDGKVMLVSKPMGEILERITLIYDIDKMEYSEVFTNTINRLSEIDEPTYGTIRWLP